MCERRVCSRLLHYPLQLREIAWAADYVLLGCVYCITIVGVPFGLQLFKMAKLSLLPFGASIVDA